MTPSFLKNFSLQLADFCQGFVYTLYCRDSLWKYLCDYELLNISAGSHEDFNQPIPPEPFFENLPEELLKQGENRFALYHFTGTHDIEFSLVPPLQNRNRYLQKGKQDLDGVARFLELLRKSGVYENSYLVVMGDHGNHLEPVLERKNPFLLVKRPGDTHEPMATNEQPIFLRDIAPTILKDKGIVTKESYSF